MVLKKVIFSNAVVAFCDFSVILVVCVTLFILTVVVDVLVVPAVAKIMALFVVVINADVFVIIVRTVVLDGVYLLRDFANFCSEWFFHLSFTQCRILNTS